MELPEMSVLLDALADRVATRVADEVVRRLQEALPAEPEPARLLSVEEVAARLGISSRAAVYKLVQRGTVPSVRVGTRLRFRSDQIDDFIRGLDRSPKRVAELAREARRLVR